MTRPERVNVLVRTRNVGTGIRITNTRKKRQGARVTGRQVLLIMFLVILLMGSGIGFVWSNFETTQLGYDITQLKKEEMRLRELNNKLRVELAFLKSPANLESRATRKLGLRQPKPEQIVILP